MCKRKHVNFAKLFYININISNEPHWLQICTLFVVNFVFLSVTFVGIS